MQSFYSQYRRLPSQVSCWAKKMRSIEKGAKGFLEFDSGDTSGMSTLALLHGKFLSTTMPSSLIIKILSRDNQSTCRDFPQLLWQCTTGQGHHAKTRVFGEQSQNIEFSAEFSGCFAQKDHVAFIETTPSLFSKIIVDQWHFLIQFGTRTQKSARIKYGLDLF